MPCSRLCSKSGSYAYSSRRPRADRLKNSTPIVIGWGGGETFIASMFERCSTTPAKSRSRREIGERSAPIVCSTAREDVHRPIRNHLGRGGGAQGDHRTLLKEIMKAARAADTSYALAQGRQVIEDITLRQEVTIKRMNLSPAARPGTLVWWVNFCSRKSPVSPPKSTTARSFATARR
jgi:hypothetical protein